MDRTPPNPDPFGWEAKRRRQWHALKSQLAAEEEAARGRPRSEEDELFLYFTNNAQRILFVLVTAAADPAASHVPYITPEAWASRLKIRPTQAANALRNLSDRGIVAPPQHPAPIPLDGLLRFLAAKLKAEEPQPEMHGPEDCLYISLHDWIKEYVASQTDLVAEEEESRAADLAEGIVYAIWERSGGLWGWAGDYVAEHGRCGLCRVRVGVVAMSVSMIDVDHPAP